MCDWNGSGEWLCNVSAAAGNSNVTVVSDYLTTSGDDYEAWGDVNGVLFCCEAECDVETNVRIEGSPGSDVLTFEYSALTYNLNSACGNNISGTINGNNGNDTIRGSNSAAGTYVAELLNGGVGADTMFGNGGDDTMNGNNGDDTMDGGIGRDTMDGGAHMDFMRGGDHDDTMLGGADPDRMSGGNGDDTMDGGAGGDVMCGDAHGAFGDIVDDGDVVNEAFPDVLWGNSATLDSLYCGANLTLWDGVAATGCGTNPTTATRPTACP